MWYFVSIDTKRSESAMSNLDSILADVGVVMCMYWDASVDGMCTGI